MFMVKEKAFFTISSDLLFKSIMMDEDIRNYILKVCFDIHEENLKCSNVELAPENVKQKFTITDYKLENKDKIYVIEMQNRCLHNMGERWMYSITRVLNNEIKLGEDIKEIREVSYLVIQNYHDKEDDSYRVIGDIYKSIYTEKMRIKVFDIPKELQSKVKERRTLAKLFRVKSLEELRRMKLNNKIEEKIRRKIEMYNAEEELYHKMKEEENTMGLIEEGMNNAKKLGISIGRNEGISIGEKQGVKKNTKQLAKRMLKEGATTDFVSKVTGLSKKVLMTML